MQYKLSFLFPTLGEASKNLSKERKDEMLSGKG
jgi:hypothetical protein